MPVMVEGGGGSVFRRETLSSGPVVARVGWITDARKVSDPNPVRLVLATGECVQV